LNPDEIFGECTTCNLGQIFGKKKSRYQKRTSSGDWSKDQRELKEARKGGLDSQTMEHQRRMIALRSWLFTFTQLDNYRQSDDDNAYKEDFNNLDIVTAVVRITEEIFECDGTTFIPPVSVDEAWAMIYSMVCEKGLLSSTDVPYNDMKGKCNLLTVLLCHAMYKCASRKAYRSKSLSMPTDHKMEIVAILRAYKNVSSDNTNSNSDDSIEQDNNSTGDEDISVSNDADVKMNAAADSNKLEERGERPQDPPAFDEATQLRKLLQESIAREDNLKKENEDLTSKLNFWESIFTE